MLEPEKPEILLLGCGYTLERVAKILEPGSYIATVRSEARAKTLSKLGIPYEFCPLDIKEFISAILLKYPSIKVILDSVPPLPHTDSTSSTTGVRNVIASLENSKVERIIYCSTSGVFGVSDGSWVDETSEAKPDNPKSQARLDCENLYRKSGVPSVSIRIVGIYGPGRGIGLSLKHGRKVDLGPPSRWTNRIHVEDLVTVLNCALKAPVADTLPEIICACDDEPALASSVLEHYKNLLGLADSSNKTSPDNNINTERSRSTLNQRVSNALMKGLIGLNLKYPSFREGAGTEFSTETDLS